MQDCLHDGFFERYLPNYNLLEPSLRMCQRGRHGRLKLLSCYSVSKSKMTHTHSGNHEIIQTKYTPELFRIAQIIPIQHTSAAIYSSNNIYFREVNPIEPKLGGRQWDYIEILNCVPISRMAVMLVVFPSHTDTVNRTKLQFGGRLQEDIEISFCSVIKGGYHGRCHGEHLEDLL